MTIDLWYLAATALLTSALWIPYIACQVMTNGFLAPENYVDPAPRPVPLWGQRAHRAFLNGVESFGPFAALVIVAHVAGKTDAMTIFWTMSSSGCASRMRWSIGWRSRSCGRSSSRWGSSASSASSSNS
jgi:hypothetical protein